MPSQDPPATASRREVLRQGRKFAYAAPVVIAALKVESTFAASGGMPGNGFGDANHDHTGPPGQDKDKQDKQDK